MDSLDWHILDLLADDSESIIQISNDIDKKFNTNMNEIKLRLVKLCNEKYIGFFSEADLIITDFINEPSNVEYSDFWFGLLEKGAEFWENNAKKYFGENISWEDAKSVRLNYHEGKGMIFGITRNACVDMYQKFKDSVKGITIFDDSIKSFENIEFEYKYYKKLTGHIIEFRFKTNDTTVLTRDSPKGFQLATLQRSSTIGLHWSKGN